MNNVDDQEKWCQNSMFELTFVAAHDDKNDKNKFATKKSWLTAVKLDL